MSTPLHGFLRLRCGECGDDKLLADESGFVAAGFPLNQVRHSRIHAWQARAHLDLPGPRAEHGRHVNTTGDRFHARQPSSCRPAPA